MPELPTPEAVFGRRPVPKSNRTALGYEAGQEAKAYARAGEVLQESGARLQDEVVKRQKARDDMDMLKAESFAIDSTTALELEFMKDQDYATQPQRYNERFAEIQAQAMSLVRNPRAQEIFSYSLNNIKTKGMASIQKSAYEKELGHYRAQGIELFDKNTRAATQGLQLGKEDAAMASIANQLAFNESQFRAGAIDEETYAKEKVRIPRDMADQAFLSLTDEQQRGILNKMGPAAPVKAKTFDEASEFVIDRLENTPTVTPDGKGNVRWGINSIANPDVDLDTLTKEGAKKLYKERYWDAIGADSLPESIRFAAFDSAVVQGVGQTKKWLEESKGDVNKFMSLRRAGFEKLGGDNLPGWIGRLETVRGEIGGYSPTGFAGLLPQEKIPKYIEALEARAITKSNKINTAIKDEITNIQNQVPSGEEAIASIESHISSGEVTPEVIANYEIMKTLRADADVFRGKNPRQIEQDINTVLLPNAMKDGATDIERERLAFARKYLSNSMTNLYDDAITYANNQGVLPEPLESVDLEDPTSLKARAFASKKVRDFYGASGFFTKPEVAELKEVWGKASPEQKLYISKSIASGAGEFAPQAFAELNKDSLPDEYFGNMVAISPVFEDTAKIGFFGLDIMKKDEKRKPNERFSKDVTAAMKSSTNMLDAEQQAAMFSAISAIYVGLGGDPETIDGPLREESIRLAAGGMRGNRDTGIVEINGKKTLMPATVSGSNFKRAVANIENDDIPLMTANKSYLFDRFGERVLVEDIRSSGYLRAVGQGQYAIFLKTDDQPLLGSNGNLATIRLDKDTIDGLLSKAIQ